MPRLYFNPYRFGVATQLANAGLYMDLSTYPGTISEIDTTTTNYDINSVMSNASTSPKLVKYVDANGIVKYRWAPHNVLEDSQFNNAQWAFNNCSQSGTSPNKTLSMSGHTNSFARAICGMGAPTATDSVRTLGFRLSYTNHPYWQVYAYMAATYTHSVIFDIEKLIVGQEGLGTASVESIAKGIHDNGDGTVDCWITSTAAVQSNQNPQLVFADGLTGLTLTDSLAQNTTAAGTETVGFHGGFLYYGPYQPGLDLEALETDATTDAFGIPVEWDTEAHELPDGTYQGAYALLHEPSSTNVATNSTSASRMTKTEVGTDGPIPNYPYWYGTGDATTNTKGFIENGINASGDWVVRKLVKYNPDADADFEFFWFTGYTGATDGDAWFDMSSGVPVPSDNNLTASGVEEVGDGWYWIWTTINIDAGDTAGIMYHGVCTVDTAFTSTANIVTHYFSLVEIAQGSDYSTVFGSPIPTYGTSTTRDGDEVYLDNANVGSLAFQDTVTLNGSYKILGSQYAATNSAAIGVGDSLEASGQYLALVTWNTGTSYLQYDGASGLQVNQAITTPVAFEPGERRWFALGAEADNTNYALDWTQAAPDTVCAAPNTGIDIIHFGNRSTSTTWLSTRQYVYDMDYRVTRVTDDVLVDLTFPGVDTPTVKSGTNFLLDEPDGLVVDGMNDRCYVKDSTTETNTTLDTVAQTFTNGTTSPKQCRQADGTYKWSPHNLLDYSETFTSGWTMLGAGSISSAGLVTADAATTGEAAYVAADTTLFNGNTYDEYTVSVQVTPGTHDIISLMYRNVDAHHCQAVFRLAGDGIKGETEAVGNTVIDSRITAVGDGSYWCELTFSSSQQDTTPVAMVFFAEDVTGNTFATGTKYPTWGTARAGTETFTIHRGQFNKGRERLEYIENTNTTAVYGAARDYDQVEQCYGVLHEPSSTNLVTQGHTATGWILDKVTLTFGETGPDGSDTAFKMTNTAATGSHVAYDDYTISNATQYTQSVFVNATNAKSSWVAMQTQTSGADYVCYFDCSGDGSVGTEGANVTGSIERLGSTSWYRCSTTWTSTATTSRFHVYSAEADGDASYLGATSEFLLFWRPQLELGPMATSPIYTTGSSATRDQDELAWLSIGMPDIKATGTYEMDFRLPAPTYSTSGNRIFSELAHDASNKIRFNYWQSNNFATQYVPAGSFSNGHNILSTQTMENRLIMSQSWASNSGYYGREGTVSAEDTVFTTITAGKPDDLRIGQGATAAENLGTSLYVYRITALLSKKTDLDVRTNWYWQWVNRDLLDGYTDGVAIDAENNTISIKDSTTVKNRHFYHGIAGLFTNGTTSPKLCLQSDGTYKWSPHNLQEDSHNMGGSAWTPARMTVSGNTLTSTAATSQSVRHLNDPGTAHHVADRLYTVAYNVTPGSWNYIQIVFYNDPSKWFGAAFDISSKVVGGTAQSATGTTVEDAGIIEEEDGSVTVWVSGIPDGTIDGTTWIGFLDDNSTTSWVSTDGRYDFSSFSAGETITVNKTAVMEGGYNPESLELETTTAKVYGVARDYDPDESTYSILCEQIVTNSVTDGVDLTTWVDDGLTHAESGTPSYVGGFSNQYTVNSGTGVKRSYDTKAHITTSTNYTISCVAKAGTHDYIALTIGFGGNEAGGVFDLATGAVGETRSAGTGTCSSSKITPLGNGFYRCEAVVSFSTSASNYIVISAAEAATGNTWGGALGISWASAAAGDETFYVELVQEEPGTVATSPIPTYGSTVSRDQDELTILEADLKTLTPECSIILDLKRLGSVGTNQLYFSLDDGGSAGRSIINHSSSTSKPQFIVLEDGGSGHLMGAAADPGTGRFKIAARVDQNNFAVSFAGNTVVTDISGSVPSDYTDLKLGHNYDTSAAGERFRFYSVVVIEDLLDNSTLESEAT